MRRQMTRAVWICILSLIPTIGICDDRSIEVMGDNLQIALPIAAYGLSFLKEDREGAIQFTKSFLATVGITHILKPGINKTRPNGGEHSFPSGHSAAAFSGAAYINRRYGLVYGVPAYAAASYVGWSRVKTEHHWKEDVFGAAIIAIGVNQYFVDSQKTDMPALSLSIEPNGATIHLAHRW